MKMFGFNEKKLHPDPDAILPGGGNEDNDNELEKEKLEELKYILSRGRISGAKELLESFPLSEEKIQEASYERLKSLLSRGGISGAKELLESFPLPEEKLKSPEIQEAVYEGLRSLLSEGDVYKAKELLESFPLPEEKVQEAVYEGLRSLLSGDEVYKAKELLDSFPLPEEKYKELFEIFNENIEVQILIQVQSKTVLDKNIKKTIDIFGTSADKESYEMIKCVADARDKSEIPQYLLDIGIKNVGDTGINQLENWFRVFKQEILKEDFDPKVLVEKEFANIYFKQYIRFDQAEWTGEGHNFDEILERYIEVSKSSEYDIEPLNPNYTPSPVLNIDKVSKEARVGFEYSEQFVNRFTTLVEDIKNAKELYESDDRNKLSSIAKDLDVILKTEITKLKEKLETVPEKGRPFLEKRLEKLESINTRSIESFQENYKFLSGLKGTENLLRKAIFTFSYAKNRQALSYNIDRINTKRPNKEDISWVLNFIDHITNQETFADYFTDKEALSVFEKTINTSALSEELNLMENQDTIGTKKMQFVPTRGLLLEFSGHMADACWADKYSDTIPATFPNFTSVSMIQNPGTANERIAGSCLLIETTSKNGDPLLVIRGLNPIENVINELKVSDFYKKYTEYIKELADRTGRKLAIVIDDHSGGSSTNRPTLFSYLSSLELKRVNVPYDDTEFNGYDITSVTYLVE